MDSSNSHETGVCLNELAPGQQLGYLAYQLACLGFHDQADRLLAEIEDQHPFLPTLRRRLAERRAQGKWPQAVRLSFKELN